MSQQFNTIWEAAFAQFKASNNIGVGREDDLSQLRSIDELISYIRKEHAQYDLDSASSKFTEAIKNSLGPLKFLLNTGGSAAGDVCCAPSLGPFVFSVAHSFSDLPWRLADATCTHLVYRSKSLMQISSACISDRVLGRHCRRTIFQDRRGPFHKDRNVHVSPQNRQ